MLTIQQLKSIYADIYNFNQIWCEKKIITDEEWQTILDDGNAILKKHTGSEFCKEMLVSVISELNRNTGGKYEV